MKSIETRHWSTGVRGLIAVHAAKRWTPDENGIVVCPIHALRVQVAA
jgi:hypothetical protein